MKKAIKIGVIILLVLVLAMIISIFIVNGIVVSKAKRDYAYSITGEDPSIPRGTDQRLRDLDADCIMVLGAGIKDDETPSDILKDRLDAGIALYQGGYAPKLLLTGDNGTAEHNEIHVMLNYCLDKGVPPEDIFCDHAGFSTYESMARAKDIFGVEKMIEVTQKFHIYRALYISRTLGMDILGVSSDQGKYEFSEKYQNLRELLARNKDFYNLKFHIIKAVGGDPIDIKSDGRVSHGE
jgi:SanA protein